MTHTSLYDILVIGSLNADLVVRTPRFPEPGETISGEDLNIIPGGKGANQAVAAAKLGAQVAMVGRVGSDSFGPFLTHNLNSNQVNTEHVSISDSATGTAIIVVDSNGQNRIVLSPGANGKVAMEDADAAPGARVLLLQFEIPMETVLHAAKRYKSQGATVILNPAPARSIPGGLLTHVDILIPNESELSLLTGMPVTDTASAEAAAREILKRGVETVIVTLGSKGALIVNGSQTQQVDTFKVDVVDTTAAGDAFIGGFASAMLNGTSLEDSVRYGCACGALATTKFGAQPSLPTRDEVENFISQHSQNHS